MKPEIQNFPEVFWVICFVSSFPVNFTETILTIWTTVNAI